MRAWILPLAGLGLILYANMKMDVACRCGGPSPWFFYLLSFRLEPGAILLRLALSVQIWLCLLLPNHPYVKIGIVLCVVAILIAPDMNLLADNKTHPFSTDQWRDALTGRGVRAALLGFLALFINLSTALFRSNAYILSKI
jgi:hypothetical protein